MATARVRIPDVAQTDVAVRVNAEVAREARIVAAYKGVPLARYISETLRPIVRHDLEEESAQVRKPKGPRPPGKRPGREEK
jgi:hypothetical protein